MSSRIADNRGVEREAVMEAASNRLRKKLEDEIEEQIELLRVREGAETGVAAPC